MHEWEAETLHKEEYQSKKHLHSASGDLHG